MTELILLYHKKRPIFVYFDECRNPYYLTEQFYWSFGHQYNEDGSESCKSIKNFFDKVVTDRMKNIIKQQCDIFQLDYPCHMVSDSGYITLVRNTTQSRRDYASNSFLWIKERIEEYQKGSCDYVLNSWKDYSEEDSQSREFASVASNLAMLRENCRKLIDKKTINYHTKFSNRKSEFTF